MNDDDYYAGAFDALVAEDQWSGSQPPKPDTTSTWNTVSLTAILNGETADDRPAVLMREDGPCLLYPGKMTAVYGESESLKTWLLLIACQQEIGLQHHVMYLDFEDCAEGVTTRLLALGCKPDRIEQYFHYYAPREPVSPYAWTMMQPVIDLNPTMAVIDGTTEAMVLHGLDPVDNTDVAAFYHKLPRPLTRHGMAVPMIDHVVKNGETRGRYALGAVHKLNGLDGAGFSVENTQEFGVGKHGISKIIVQKDRRGHVREFADRKHVADLNLQSMPDGTIVGWLAAPGGTSSPAFRPTELMAKALAYITANPGLSKSDIVTAIGGKKEYALLAVSLLVREGTARVEKGPRGRENHYPTVPAGNPHDQQQ